MTRPYPLACPWLELRGYLRTWRDPHGPLKGAGRQCGLGGRGQFPSYAEVVCLQAEIDGLKAGLEARSPPPSQLLDGRSGH